MQKSSFILFFLTSFFCFLIAEICTRAYLYHKTPSGMIFTDSTIYGYLPKSIVQGMKMNNLGCIGDDISPRERERERVELRVLLLGGSTSFTVYYVNTLRTELLRMYPNKKIKVISCGRPRYTSYSNKIILNEIGETIAPDLIITYMGINDNVYNSFSWLNDSPNVGYFNWKDSKISVFYDALKYYLYVKPFRSNSSFTSIRSKSIFTNNLEEIILWASNHNSRLLLTTFAISYPTTDKNLLKKLLVQEPTIKHFWGDLPSTAKGTDAHNEVSLMLANKYHLPLAPVASNIPKDSKHFLDLCHLTEDGYKILVNTLIETLFHNTASS